MARLEFAWWVLGQRLTGRGRKCPYCGSTQSTFLQRKKILMQARRCAGCAMIFRYPTDDSEKAGNFYKHSYKEGPITTLPAEAQLAHMKSGGFAGTVYEKSVYLDILRRACPGRCRVLDLGASWGYLAFQMRAAGYEAEGMEVSRRRAEFGQRALGVRIYSAWEGVPSAHYGAIFTAHTLEHLHDLRGTLEQIDRALADRGKLIIIVPNGGGANAKRLGVGWGPYLGEAHTMAFTADWFKSNLHRHGLTVLSVFSSPEDFSCEGDELVCIAQKK